MPTIILDGPEKAGKTTLANEIVRLVGARYRHWGPLLDDTAYMRALQEDARSGDYVVWDRSWASQSVYDVVEDRWNRFSFDPWLGEWLYGRAAQRLGVAAVVTGPSPAVLAARRDGSDIAMEPALEQAQFVDHGRRFGWVVLGDPAVDLHAAAWMLANLAHSNCDVSHVPPAFAGPNLAPVVFVGERRNEGSHFPGAWLPFSTPLTSGYGRALGDDAFRCQWTNAEDGCGACLGRARLVVACGNTAAAWVERSQWQPAEVLRVPHPAYLYRWAPKSNRLEVEATLIDRVRAALQPANLAATA